MKNKQPKKVLVGRNKKDVVGNIVRIKNSTVTEKRLVTKYSKFQLLVSKFIGVIPEDSYQYCFRIEYFGSIRLKVRDLVINSEKVVFMVVKESNGLAMLVASKAYNTKPKVFGSLTIVDREKQKTLK